MIRKLGRESKSLKTTVLDYAYCIHNTSTLRYYVIKDSLRGLSNDQGSYGT